jgi:signal transduction histidine kinase
MYFHDRQIGGIMVVANDITEQIRSQEALNRMHQELAREYQARKQISKRLLEMLEDDRRQVARELHDHLGQRLTTMRIKLETQFENIFTDDARAADMFKESIRHLDEIINEVRKISRGLRPEMLEKLGLISALHSLINEVEIAADVKVQFFSRNVPPRFDREKELALFRIAQEALTNIIKHASAETVHIDLMVKDKSLIFSVEDDGVGFDVSAVKKKSYLSGSTGLSLMRERILQIGGELSIESSPGRGTSLLAELPLN